MKWDKLRACGDLCTARVGASPIAFLLPLPNFNLLETSITDVFGYPTYASWWQDDKKKKKIKGYLLSLVTHSNVPKTTWRLFLINISK